MGLTELKAGEVYSYKSVYTIKVCSILASKAIVSEVGPSGTNSCQLTDQIHHGNFMLKNEGTEKYLNTDCLIRCVSGTNVDQREDSIFFSSNRVFELKSEGDGSGIHWLKHKDSELWVAQWVDSVKLATDAQRDDKLNPTSWNLL